jgi:hypothetical protein
MRLRNLGLVSGKIAVGAVITGISHFEGDSWYAQCLWPVFRSNIAGSESAADGSAVKVDVAPQDRTEEFLLGSKVVEV